MRVLTGFSSAMSTMSTMSTCQLILTDDLAAPVAPWRYSFTERPFQHVRDVVMS